MTAVNDEDSKEALPAPLRTLVRHVRLKQYPKGQIIFYQGDELSHVFIVKSGAVKIYDIDDQGNEKILHITKSPAVVPFSFFSGGLTPPRWFYSALTDCELYVMSTEELERAMAADTDLAFLLTQFFSRDVHELLVRLSSLGKTRARDKLVATLWFLLVQHSKEKRPGWYRVSFAVNHQLLADIAGITRERAAIVMKDLQDKKIVRSPHLNRLDIHKARLVEFSE